ncbi:hypothetical protein ACMYUJ_17055 [Stutzerimonas zhaodongensis]|uniref:hypothetical protein n=1 Tax=Stutzerimonas zhaodongensis TaxID=1176257 RepID=UPI0039F034F3
MSPFLMGSQTLDFLEENFRLAPSGPIQYDQPYPIGLHRQANERDAPLTLRLQGTFDAAGDAREQVDQIIDYVGALAVSVDFPLHVLQIAFNTDGHGPLLQAVRKPFARGVGLEVEERGVAATKLTQDFGYFLGELKTQGSAAKIAIRHYMTGMTLLSLEDHTPGLIDAAFMQFYQGIEACLGLSNLGYAKKEIARRLNGDRSTQIVCHQIFCVRHKYFGHGDEISFHEIADRGAEEAYRIAKQCLVAKWLCRRLIDSASPSGSLFSREMRLYGPSSSDCFYGSLQELETQFWADFSQGSVASKAECKVYDQNGGPAEGYVFKSAPVT